MNNQILLNIIFIGLGLLGLYLLFGGIYITLSKANAEKFLRSRISQMYFELEFFEVEKRHRLVRYFFVPLTIVFGLILMAVSVSVLMNPF